MGDAAISTLGMVTTEEAKVTKRWSSSLSDPAKTKRQASKADRRAYEKEAERDLHEAEEALADLDKNGGTSFEDLRKELEEAL